MAFQITLAPGVPIVVPPATTPPAPTTAAGDRSRREPRHAAKKAADAKAALAAQTGDRCCG